MQRGITEKRIDRLDLPFLHESAQQPVAYDDDVQRFASAGAAIKVTHDRAIVLMQDLDLNVIPAFEFCNQPSLGERTKEPFVPGQANGHGTPSLAAELQNNQNRQSREHHTSGERSNHGYFSSSAKPVPDRKKPDSAATS
jgi:hypothetical protein